MSDQEEREITTGGCKCPYCGERYDREEMPSEALLLAIYTGTEIECPACQKTYYIHAAVAFAAYKDLEEAEEWYDGEE